MTKNRQEYPLKGIKQSELGLCDAMVWEENKKAIHLISDIKSTAVLS